MCAGYVPDIEPTLVLTGTKTFTASLGPKNGVPSHAYTFRNARDTRTADEKRESHMSYNAVMIAECQKHGMKPVCNHPVPCKADTRALYIGQSSYIALPHSHASRGLFPGGWNSALQRNWAGLCSYTGVPKSRRTSGVYKQYTRCNIPIKSSSWRLPSQYNPGFVCGKVVVSTAIQVTAKLGAKNGVLAREYTFARAVDTRDHSHLSANDAKTYSDVMIDECKKHGMKPVCDHPAYCKNDAKALYIGQSEHLAYAPHRETSHYFPAGWSGVLRRAWEGQCSYTGWSFPLITVV